MTTYSELVDSAASRAMENLEHPYNGWNPRLYLYFRPSAATTPGELRLAPESPGDGWELAAQDSIPPGSLPLNRFERAAWIGKRSRYLPILPTPSED